MSSGTIIQLVADNKIDISESLTTHSVWQNTIKCDPLDKKLYPDQDKTRKRRNNISVCDLITRTAVSSMPTCTKCGECILTLILSGTFDVSMYEYIYHQGWKSPKKAWDQCKKHTLAD